MARLDKFLWSVRLYKTRSQSAEACKKNRVLINQEEVKPSKTLKVDDIITIKKSGIHFEYKVIALNEKRVGAKLVDQFIIDITSAEAVEKYKLIQMTQRQYRQQGLGRPTKKKRRDIDNFMN